MFCDPHPNPLTGSERKKNASSSEIIRDCVNGALSEAAAASCRSLAMPVFATGHAAYRFNDAVEIIGDALKKTNEPIDEVFLAVMSPERLRQATTILARLL